MSKVSGSLLSSLCNCLALVLYLARAKQHHQTKNGNRWQITGCNDIDTPFFYLIGAQQKQRTL
jgi:hypothetical protein